MRISTTLASLTALLLLSGAAMAEQGMISTGQDIKQLEQDEKIKANQPEQSGRSAADPAAPMTKDQQEQQKTLEGAAPAPR